MWNNGLDVSGYYQPTDGRAAYLRILGQRISWHEAGREVYHQLEYEVTLIAIY